MQSTAIKFSPSFLASNDPRKLICHRFNPLSSLSPKYPDSVSFPLTCKITPIRSSFKEQQRGWISAPPVTKDDSVAVHAAAAAESAASDDTPKTSSFSDTLVLGLLFGMWYFFTVYFSIYSKQVLEVFPYPVTVTLSQFAVGTVIVILMWTLKLYKRPKISGAQLATIIPLAVMHTLGNLFTNMSLGKVSVSFTHTIKAMEPFFSVILSAMFLGENPTIWVGLSLLPIVGGVSLASMTEISFNWVGFWSAMASNLTNQYRNVLSKKLMVKKEDALDNITLFSVITIVSFILMVPITILMEGIKFTPSYLEAAGLNINEIFTRSLLAALSYHAYQQVAYMLLERISPVTHSVGNCVKRVVIIIASVLFFRTPVSPVNSLGTGIALAGVFLYSRATRIKRKAT